MVFLASMCLGGVVPAGGHAAARFVTPPAATLEATRAGPDVFTAGGIGKECEAVEFRATLLDSSRSLELSPFYGECTTKSLGGLPTKMVWWGCGYVLHPEAVAGRQGSWTARVDIVCPDAHEMEWNVYESTADYNIADTLCVTSMPPQRTGGVAELSNTGGPPGEIAVHWKLSGIDYEAFGSNLFCGLAPDTPKSDASYTGRAVIGAKDPAGRASNLELVG